MEDAIDKFEYKLKSGDGVGLFYYAGHGIEVNGINYLIPTDAKISSKKYIKSKSVSIDIIISAMEEAKNRLNILILDSCRSNPFNRGREGGLAPINSATGIYVAYATAPNRVAEDGDGDNGLFTSYLIKYINKAGLKIEDVFKRVRSEVKRVSNGTQIPWSSSSIMGDFYFTLPSNTINTNTLNIIPTMSIDSKIQALEKACKLNSAKACNRLGHKYYYGKGISVNYNKAIEYYKKSCDLNYGKGCGSLGVMYYKGKGVSKDSAKALEIFKKGYHLNDGFSSNYIGNCYYYGKGIIRDYSKSAEYYKKACNLKYGLGCNNLGSRYYYGQGVSKDYSKSVEYYKKACDLKYGEGCNNLGSRYYYGQGVEKNIVKAREFYKKSCNLNYIQGCTNYGTY